ncbi:MAG: DegV family protein [Pseudomonadota bacterium]
MTAAVSKATQSISVNDFASALLCGIQHVVRSQETLNKINVFPVADGDTGTNMALTLVAARKSLIIRPSDSMGKLLARTADALLDGARGNSGAIMAQFFQGLSDGAIELAEFSTQNFTDAVAGASRYAREALSEPREGTIISVIGAFSKALASKAPEPAFLKRFEHGLAAAKTALARTPDQLSVLKKAGVVDAGAQGFVHMLEGMASFFQSGELIDSVFDGEIPELTDQSGAGDVQDLDYRYCTECVITGTQIDRRKLREALTELGGSLVLAGTHAKAKVHIHVNDPQAVFRLAESYGTLSSQKADDMQAQQQASHAQSAKVAIITDSAADIPDEQLEALNIHLVPLRVNFGDRGYMDKVSINADEFYDELARNPIHPKTSQPTPGDLRRQYQFLASHYDDVLAISVTGKVSGTLQAAQAAAKRVKAQGKVHVLDCRNASVGQGLITTRLARLVEQGEPAEKLISIAEDLFARTRSFALLKDLEFSVRGGRVPAYAHWIATRLRLNPVLQTKSDGQVKPAGVLFGRGNRVAKFARYITRRARPGVKYRLSIGQAQCESDAKALAQALSQTLDLTEEPIICELGAAIGVHGGSGTLVAAIAEDWPA